MAFSPETLGAAIAILQNNSGGSSEITGRLDEIEGKIPSTANTDNKLADKAYVDESINSSSAFFRGSFQTKAALLAVQWQTSSPTTANYVSNNDFAYVAADESHSNEAWRYSYVYESGGQNNGWTAQYRINETPLTQEQLAAINSGITSEKVAEIGSVFTGASVSAGGVKGVVPAPDTTGKYLSSDGTWKSVDTTPTISSANLVTSGGVKAALDGKQDALTFDNVPTSESNNPVKSGGVYTALSGKQDALTFDNAPTENSTNPVKSGGVYSALAGKQAALTFDNAPTTGSNNPVKSGGIKTALDAKQNTLTFDSTPTSSSTNPVTSGGIYAALQALTPQIVDHNLVFGAVGG